MEAGDDETGNKGKFDAVMAGVARKMAAAAMKKAMAPSPVFQVHGSQSTAQDASQVPVAVRSLQELAHAEDSVCRQTVGLITRELMPYMTMGDSREIFPATVQSFIETGLELQRSVDFNEQARAKIWAMRVLCWFGSIVSLGILPGLANLFARDNEFADSLQRYLFGNGEINREKQGKADALFDAFRELDWYANENTRLQLELNKAQEIPSSLQEVAQQLDETARLGTRVPSYSLPSDVKGDETRARYGRGQEICRRYLNNNSKCFNARLSSLRGKLDGLQEGVEASDIRAKVQCLSVKLQELEGTMLSGEGGNSAEIPDDGYQDARTLSYEEMVERQAQEISEMTKSLEQAFEEPEFAREIQAAQERAAAIRAEQDANKGRMDGAKGRIFESMLELGPTKVVPGNTREVVASKLNGIFNEYFVQHEGEAADRNSHWNFDYPQIARALLDGGGLNAIPKNCYFRVDALRAFNFTLTVGNTTINGMEILRRHGAEEGREQAIREIVEAVRVFAEENNLDPVAVLANLLRTYIGQTALAVRDESINATNNDGVQYSNEEKGIPDSNITIGKDGSCLVSHDFPILSLAGACMHKSKVEVVVIPADIRMTMAYESSLEDLASGRPPHAIKDQCTCTGRYLNLSAMAKRRKAS
jgi:hypothetical protein